MQKGERMEERPGFSGHAHVNGEQLLPQVVAWLTDGGAGGATKGKVGCIA